MMEKLLIAVLIFFAIVFFFRASWLGYLGRTLIITTSKFHTRRARYVWGKVLGREDGIYTSAAADDPFDPNGWWGDGRQVKQVMGEYGAMAYYLWKRPW